MATQISYMEGLLSCVNCNAEQEFTWKSNTYLEPEDAVEDAEKEKGWEDSECPDCQQGREWAERGDLQAKERKETA